MYTFIDSLEDLAFLNDELMSKPFIGVDTEFRRTNKDNMKLALLQINDGEEIFLIDTLSILDPGDKVSFLLSSSVLKILHSCKEDLEAIYAWTNSKMVNIFDTQLANSFLHNEYSISYQGLVERHLGVILEKKETRSNWTRRPLTDAQLKYASLDVEYLIPLYLEQNKALSKTDKINWLAQDVERLIEVTFNPNLSFNELSRTIPKAKEIDLLLGFNKMVDRIADKEGINSTLFFSKKAQKEFLRLALMKGIEMAFREITPWRRELIKDEFPSILR